MDRDRVAAARPGRRRSGCWIGLAAACALACGPAERAAQAPDAGVRRPSVLLVVIDTLRARAVSCYGSIEGTTPTIDALATQSLVYRHAYSPSSWTLPSHASLFSGLGVDRHRVGMPGRLMLPEAIETLAERFQAAGYETAAFVENMLVSDVFQMLQGFEYKRASRVIGKNEKLPVNVFWEVELERDLPRWLEQHDPSRPFFLFLNLFDPHTPYTVRDENRWVPAGASQTEMKRYAENPQQQLCDAYPSEREVEILEGLYLGDVAAADAKLGVALALLRERDPSLDLITVVTSDHGEIFGERRLLGHEFNLRNSALHVPLIVHGLADVAPAEIDEPVTLVDVAPSLLHWTGIDAAGPFDGRRLPVAPDETQPPRMLRAAYSDDFEIAPAEWKGLVLFGDKDYPRRACGPADPVFGGMASLLEYPFKLHWFERYPAQLYDLSWDPLEQSDLAAHRPDLVARLTAALAQYTDDTGVSGKRPATIEAPSEEAVRSLEALGYVE